MECQTVGVLAAGRRGDLHELMAYTVVYSGLRQGEMFALTTAQVDPAARVIDVDRKVIEVAGQLTRGAPKGRKRRKTIYPARTPQGYPLAEMIAVRIQQAQAEQDAGTNPAGLLFPSPAAPGGGPPTSTAASWPPPTTGRLARRARHGPWTWTWTWTWHSLCHVLRTTALFTWKLDPTDVSAIAGHANVRTTLDICTAAGILDRARPPPNDFSHNERLGGHICTDSNVLALLHDLLRSGVPSQIQSHRANAW